jgi:hypothetical protein
MNISIQVDNKVISKKVNPSLVTHNWPKKSLNFKKKKNCEIFNFRSEQKKTSEQDKLLIIISNKLCQIN